MKALLYSLCLILISCTSVAENQLIASENIALSVVHYDGDPGNWLKMSASERAVPVTIDTGINNIKSIYITDELAKQDKCPAVYEKTVLHLFFKPMINATQIKTFINKPCVLQNAAKLKLHVVTQDNKTYHRSYTFPVN